MSTPLLVLLGVAGLWMVAAGVLRDRSPVWWWYLAGYPVTVARAAWSWRRLCVQTGLTGDRRGSRVMVAGLVVHGQALKPVIPPLRIGRPVRDGFSAHVRLLPGQVPAEYARQAEAVMHAWRVAWVRVSSPRRGWVEIRAYAADPLAGVVEREASAPPVPPDPHALPDAGMVLAPVVGVREDGSPWVVDLRALPHWLVVGATRSGKSTLLHALVCWLAGLPVALVGIDLKGGLELSVYGPRLSGLAVDRAEAADLLERVLALAFTRMRACRAAGVQSVWALPVVPPPVVVIVDEIAELYLSDGGAEGRAVRDRCSSVLLRLAQLGAALGVHLVLCAQRFGSELGPGATAVRAQCAGRVCARVNDEQTAEMVLGDVFPEAVAAARMIAPTRRGVAVATDSSGGWSRVRAVLTTAREAADTARRCSVMTPVLAGIARPVFAGGGAP